MAEHERVSLAEYGWAAASGPVPEMDGRGNAWVLSGLTGWHAGVAQRGQLTARPGRDGALSSPVLRGARTLSIEGYTVCPSRRAQLEAADRVAGLLQGVQRSATLRVQEFSRDLSRQCAVQMPDGGVGPLVELVGRTLVHWDIPLIAPDPVRYGTQERTWTVSAATAGRQLRNRGDAYTPCAIEFVGHIAGPRVGLLGGPFVAFPTATVTVGQVWTLDPVDGSVTDQAGVSRTKLLSADSSVWMVPPGQSVLVDERLSGAGRVTVTWRDGWT